MSSLLQSLVVVAEHWVGYDVLLAELTQNVELPLDATVLSIVALNRHMLGNCFLCLFLVQQGWPRLMYCCAF
jgi:hypothetical protein